MTSIATVNTRRGHADVVAFDGVVVTGRQELNKPADRAEVQKSLPRTLHYSPSAPTRADRWAQRLMISWAKDDARAVTTDEWAHLIPDEAKPTRVDKSGVTWKAHGGLGDISPGRGTIGVLLELTDGTRFVFLDSHFVSSAWSKKLVKRRPWRKKKWLRHEAMLQRITTALTTAGFLVVHVGDVNHTGVLDLPGLDPAGGMGLTPGYDQIHASPALKARRYRRADGPDRHGSDHYPRAADIGPKEATPVPDLTINQKFFRALRDDGVTVLSRDQWGSNPDGRRWALAPDVDDVYQWRRANKPHQLLPDKPSDTLVQHVTVTDDTGDTRGDFKADMQALERIGFARFGSGISYNVVVDQDGMVGIGQPLDAKGTHTVNDKHVPGYSYDQNYVALAVAWIAQPGDPLTAACKDSIAAVIRALRSIDALTPGFDYVPHSLFAAKACPLQNMRDAMPGIRAAGTDTTPPVDPPVEKPTRVSNGRLLAEQAIELIGQTPDTRKGAQALADALEAVLDDPQYPTR